MHNTRPFNIWDALKILALLLMFADHAGAYFYMKENWLRSIGRGAAPIFLFLAGYASSYRFNWEIFILACAMTVSNWFQGFYFSPLNILFTILMCRAVLGWMDKRGKVITKPWEWLVALCFFAIPTNFLFEYGTLGFLIALYGYMKHRPDRYPQPLPNRMLAATLIYYGPFFVLMFMMTNIPAILLMIPVLFGIYWLLTRFEIRPIHMKNSPAWCTGLLTLTARYSGYIYAIHLIVISWITHFPI